MTDWQTHPEYLALLETVLTNPNDDAPRWIISDWLEENDQIAFAQFIRAQLELQQRIKSHIPSRTTRIENDEFKNLNRRIQELWGPIPPSNDVRKLFYQSMSNIGNWLFLIDFMTGVSFEAKGLVNRGFVSEISLPCEQFMKHAYRLFRQHPITHVWLTDKQPFHDLVTPRFATHPYSWRIATPEVSGDPTAVIPNEIALKLPAQLYRTEDSAFKALTQACVEYGRELAGLPSLNGH